MKKKFLAVALAATMVVSSAVTAFATDYQLAADSSNEFANPLKGTNPTEVKVEFDITFADDAAANGWDTLVSIYNSETKGRISFQSAPYVCYNSDGNGGNSSYFDFNSPDTAKNPDSVNKAADAKAAGGTHAYSYTITADGIKLSVDGEEITGAKLGEAEYSEAIEFANTADKLYIGVGNTAVASFWWTEICTLSNVKVNGVEVGSNGEAPKQDAPKNDDTTKADEGGAKADSNSDDGTTAAGTTDNGTAAQTGDTATAAAFALVLLAAAGAVVVLKKKNVTE